MQKRSFTWISRLAIGATLAASVTHTCASANPVAGLNNAQVQMLKSLDIPIIVPSYIPKDFEVAEITAQFCEPNDKRSSAIGCKVNRGYRVLYRNADRACFEVYGEFTAGIGGAAGEFAFKVVTKLFGETAIGFGRESNWYDEKTPSTEQLNSPQPNLSSFPVYRSKTLIVYGIRTVDRKYECNENHRLTPLDMEKILQSLQELT